MARRGRPTKLTRALADKIVNSVREGKHWKYVALGCGVPIRTMITWRKKAAKATKGLFGIFGNALRKAEAEAVGNMELLVRHGAIKDWRAAAWWLERRVNEEYGAEQKLRVSGDADAPPVRIRHESLALSRADFSELLRRMKRDGILEALLSDNGHAKQETPARS